MLGIQTLRIRLSGIRGTALVAVLAAWVAAPGAALQNAPVPTAVPQPLGESAPIEAPPLNPEQIEALVAPIALYPDPLLAQCLVASTYPLDLVSAQQWLDRNTSLKGADLEAAAEQQPWDPSVQALVAIPDALKRMSENVEWTTDLGDAFLAQEKDVMDAVQRLRVKAKEAGKLESTEQQNVEVTSVEDQTVIEIQPASTEVVYVPSYSPSVVWGVGVYPYPPIYYPPYYGGAWIGFGVGIAIGIGISGGWGWATHWGGGHNNITINNNNNYVSHHNRQNNVNRSGNSNWQHNAQQRGGTPYKDRATAQKYGGQGGARGGDFDRSRSGGGAGANRAGSGNLGSGNFDRGGSSSNRMGSRDISSSSRGGGAFGGSQSGNWSRSTSSRGASSMGGMRGGGMRGGGGRRR